MQGALGHKQKPQCVHISNVHADLLPTDVYSGMYARVTVNFFPYDASGNRGVGFGLGNVCTVSYTHLTLPTTPYV